MDFRIVSINSKEEYASSMFVAQPFQPNIVFPVGTLTQVHWQDAAWSYSGILVPTATGVIAIILNRMPIYQHHYLQQG